MESRKILIIEDDPVQGLALATQLKRAGHVIVRAADGVAAISVANHEKPDIILLDLGLPGGGGMMVLKRLRKLLHTAATPVIVITGSGADRDELLAAGAQAFMEKPVDAAAVLKVIEEVLGGNPADGSV
jgi:CheY-like chemotaxis protein